MMILSAGPNPYQCIYEAVRLLETTHPSEDVCNMTDDGSHGTRLTPSSISALPGRT